MILIKLIHELLCFNFVAICQLNFLPSILQTTTTTSALPPGTITGNRRHILNPTNLQSIPSQSPQRTLSPWSGTTTLIAASTADLDVKGGNSKFLTTGCHILRGKHSSVGGRFVTVGLDFHATCDADECLSAREISDMYEGIVEGCEEVGYGKDFLAFDSFRSECSFSVNK